jgi:hypothetical protein
LDQIRKKEFDLICLLIHPKQILGLKLGQNHFNLINEYFIQMNDEQKTFSRLRSFYLEKSILYNEELSKWIYSKIDYQNLRLFRFDQIDERFFHRKSIDSFENLSHLVGCSSTIFRRLSNQILMHLTFLHMFFNSIDDLICLLNFNFHQLKSVGIGIKCNLNDIDRFSSLLKNYQWKKLIQFNLNLQGKMIISFGNELFCFVEMNDVRWGTIKKILSPMSQLRYLTLILSKQSSLNSRLFNGYEWSLFLSISLRYLKRFDFKLPVDIQFESNIRKYLNQFQTSWWLNEKQWYIEYVSDENAFMTVPYFLNKIFDHSDLHIYDRMINPKIFYSNIRELKLNDCEEFLRLNYGNSRRFCHVKRLSLNGHLTREVFNRIRYHLDLEKIEHFQFCSTIDDNDGFIPLINKMTNLSSLDIQYRNILQLFNQIFSPIFTVRRLVLFDYKIKTMKQLFSMTCYLFPRLTHLQTLYHNRRIFRYLLKNLPSLEEINFRLNAHDHVPNHHWIASKIRLTSDSFLSEIFNLNHHERIFLIWLHPNQISSNLLKKTILFTRF